MALWHAFRREREGDKEANQQQEERGTETKRETYTETKRETYTETTRETYTEAERDTCTEERHKEGEQKQDERADRLSGIAKCKFVYRRATNKEIIMPRFRCAFCDKSLEST